MGEITKQTLLPLGLVLTVLGSIVGGALWIQSTVSKARIEFKDRMIAVEHRLEMLQVQNESRTGDRWTHGDMEHFAELLAANNVHLDLIVPQPKASE